MEEPNCKVYLEPHFLCVAKEKGVVSTRLVESPSYIIVSHIFFKQFTLICSKAS